MEVTSMITDTQRRAQDIRRRLMGNPGAPPKEKPLSYRAKVVAIRRRMEVASNHMGLPYRPLHVYSMREILPEVDVNRMPRWRRIVWEVCLKYNVKIDDVLSHCRTTKLCTARHEAMWRMRNETKMTTTQIGRVMHRDHSSAIHGIRKHAATVAN